MLTESRNASVWRRRNARPVVRRPMSALLCRLQVPLLISGQGRAWWQHAASVVGMRRSVCADRTVSQAKPVMMPERWNSSPRLTSRGDWPQPAPPRVMVVRMVTALPAAARAQAGTSTCHWPSPRPERTDARLRTKPRTLAFGRRHKRQIRSLDSPTAGGSMSRAPFDLVLRDGTLADRAGSPAWPGQKRTRV